MFSEWVPSVKIRAAMSGSQLPPGPYIGKARARAHHAQLLSGWNAMQNKDWLARSSSKCQISIQNVQDKFLFSFSKTPNSAAHVGVASVGMIGHALWLCIGWPLAKAPNGAAHVGVAAVGMIGHASIVRISWSLASATVTRGAESGPVNARPLPLAIIWGGCGQGQKGCENNLKKIISRLMGKFSICFMLSCFLVSSSGFCQNWTKCEINSECLTKSFMLCPLWFAELQWVWIFAEHPLYSYFFANFKLVF